MHFQHDKIMLCIPYFVHFFINHDCYSKIEFKYDLDNFFNPILLTFIILI